MNLRTLARHAILSLCLLPLASSFAHAQDAPPVGPTLDDTCAGCKELFVVAHEDDDILFMNPDLESAIQRGNTVRTVYLTAGDAGNPLWYWSNREAGERRAYATMAGVPDQWTASTLSLGGKALAVYTLDGAPTVSLVFLRLADGYDGTGFAVTGNQSLERLWSGALPRMVGLDGANSYARGELIDTLAAIMADLGADRVHTLDSGNRYGGDHTDHRHSSSFAFAAHQAYAPQHAHDLRAYRGYNIAYAPTNLDATARDEKWRVFTTYAAFDMCRNSQDSCSVGGAYDGDSWRQYRLSQQSARYAPLVSFGGSTCVDGADGTGASGEAAALRACDSGSASQLYTVTAAGQLQADDGRCLGVRGDDPSTGAVIELAACSGAAGQVWTVFDDGQVRGLGAKCLNISGGDPSSGSRLELAACDAVNRQQWSKGSF